MTYTQWDIIQALKEWNSVNCGNMDGTGRHYVKWNKAGIERHILCVFREAKEADHTEERE